jgi:hypothetical protein
MALHAASYFAGVGTVVATMTVGFGGGVLLTDAFVGKSERTPTLMERRAAPSESPAPVVATAPNTQGAEQPPRAVEQATAPSQPVGVQAPAPAQPATQTTISSAPQQQAVAPVHTSPAATQERPRFEQSMGRAQDADLANRDAEIKKAAAERRKQERRKWAERRKRDMQKIDELTAISEKVREADRSREREPVFRSFAAESPTPGRSPMIRLFGDSED